MDGLKSRKSSNVGTFPSSFLHSSFQQQQEYSSSSTVSERHAASWNTADQETLMGHSDHFLL